MVYVIVLNWNGASDTIACLQSLALLEGGLPKVIVCDNASTDDSWSRLQAYVENQTALEIRLVQTGANLGFAGGVNVGLRAALSDPYMTYVWILNNDTLVDPGALKALIRYMADNPDVGMCGSTLLYLDEPTVIQAVGGAYNPWFGTSRHILGQQRYDAARCRAVDVGALDYVVGAAMFVRRRVLETVGLMSESYFLYYEEIDWATRMRRQGSEFKLGYAPDSLVFHKEGASTGANDRATTGYRFSSDFFFITSRLKYTHKFFPCRRWSVQLSMLLVALNRLRKGQWRSVALALWMLLGVVPERLDPRSDSGNG